MYWSLVHYVDVGVEVIDRIRRTYDPTFDLIRPHVPVVFPVPVSVGKGRLLEHLLTTIDRFHDFPVRFRGFGKSPDHWLYLNVEDGGDDFVRLFESLYTGPLAKLRRHDVEFVPHVALGLFVKKEVRYDISATAVAANLDEIAYPRALREAEAQKIDLRSKVTRLHLVELPDTVIEWARGIRDLPADARARTVKELELPSS